MSKTPLRNTSPWSAREKIARVLWSATSALLFHRSFHNLYSFRAQLLRIFGAQIGHNVRISPSARIHIPWHLEISDDVSVGDYAILYALGTIRIGPRTFISQYAHLCAGTHDYTSLDYPLVRAPISIEEDCWIAADAFIGPGITIGARAVVGARSTVVKDVPAGKVVVGNPARVIKDRELTSR